MSCIGTETNIYGRRKTGCISTSTNYVEEDSGLRDELDLYWKGPLLLWVALDRQIVKQHVDAFTLPVDPTAIHSDDYDDVYIR